MTDKQKTTYRKVNFRIPTLIQQLIIYGLKNSTFNNNKKYWSKKV